MKIGYARVSTDEQNLDLQLDALTAAGCEQVFTDDGVSGTVQSRHGLNQALGALSDGDSLVIWKLDRLGRSLSFLISLAERFERSGIGFCSLSDNIDTTTASGKFFFHMMGAMAEFERSLISERTKAGMKSARSRGKHLGRRQTLTSAQVAHARELVETEQQTISGAAELMGVSRWTVHRALKKRLN